MKGVKRISLEVRVCVAASVADGECDRQDGPSGQGPGRQNQCQDFFP